MNKNKTIFINNLQYQPILVYTLLQLFILQNYEIPRFCYNEYLSIVGNCRMCLSEENKALKLLVACALNGIEIKLLLYTNSMQVKWSRESSLEFLLINHPLDCPICDQGGECDLQDQALVYGSDKGRFYEFKRTVENKNFGIFIKTSMNRCIHCTRCIRFANELGGFGEIGLLGRGKNIEIGTYEINFINNELSGNIIDLCPVGALTTKVSAFKARIWELEQFDSFDISDSMLSNIRVDVQNNHLIRILPYINKYLNEDWLTNKARSLITILKKIKIESPFIKINNKLVAVNWQIGYYYFKNQILKILINYNFLNTHYSIALLLILGSHCDAISSYMLKLFTTHLGFLNFLNINLEKKTYRYHVNDFRTDYLFEQNINNLINIKKKNSILLFDINLRLVVPLLNLKIKRFNSQIKKYTLIRYGKNYYSNISIKNLGINLFFFFQNIKGKGWFSHILKKKIISIILPIEKLNNSYYLNLIYWLKKFTIFFKKKKSLFFNILDKNLSTINSNELNIRNNLHSITKNILINNKIYYFIYELNNKNFYYNKLNFKKYFYIFQGNNLLKNNIILPNIIFPNKNFFENSNIFFNIEGKIKKSSSIISNNTLTKNNWQIFYTLFNYFNISKTIIINKKKIIFESLITLKTILLKCLIKNSPFFYFHNFLLKLVNYIYIKKNISLKINIKFENYFNNNKTFINKLLNKKKKLTLKYLFLNFILIKSKLKILTNV